MIGHVHMCSLIKSNGCKKWRDMRDAPDVKHLRSESAIHGMNMSAHNVSRRFIMHRTYVVRYIHTCTAVAHVTLDLVYVSNTNSTYVVFLQVDQIIIYDVCCNVRCIATHDNGLDPSHAIGAPPPPPLLQPQQDTFNRPPLLSGGARFWDHVSLPRRRRRLGNHAVN
jgi:hypothetical protein